MLIVLASTAFVAGDVTVQAGMAEPSSALVARTAGVTVTGKVTPPKLASLTAPCLDVVWIGARGSGEPGDVDRGMGRPVDVAFTGFSSRVTGRRVAYWPINYPATAVSAALATSGGRKTYFKGMDVGIRAIKTALQTRSARCPSEKYVLAGYSQGAMVVHRALFATQSTWTQMPAPRRFLGFILIADGDQLPGQKGLSLGTAGNNSGRSEGISWVLPSAAGEDYKPVGDYLPTVYRDATISVCDENDIVCDFENLHLPPVPTRVNIHTHHYHQFDSDNVAHEAGRIIGARTMRLTIQSEGLQVSNPTPTPITAGSPYSWRFKAGGGVAPYTFAHAGFAYFNGYTLASNGTFVGQSDFGFDGQITFTLQVTDARGQRINQPITITVLERDGDPEPEPDAEALPAPEQWSSISTDDTSACGVKMDGSGWCWGQLADNSTSALPVELPGDRTWQSLVVGGSSGMGNDVCGVQNNGELLCWGWISAISSFPSPSPERPRSFGAGWSSVSIGDQHACAVKLDGSAWCWGAGKEDSYGGEAGRLGNGAAADSTTPVQVAGAGNWSTVSAGMASTCGAKTDSSLWCWGGNSLGQLGTGSTEAYSLVPVQVASDQTWKSVSVGGGRGGSSNRSASACAIRTDGTAWCWATENYSTPGSSNTPIQVGESGTWTAISVGDVHVCGLKDDGSAWCWGGNASRQLGSGVPWTNGAPQLVSGAGTWTSIDVGETAGHAHTATCGIQADHSAWCWGDRSEGRLGNGTREYLATPTKVPGAGWTSLSLGRYHGCGVRADESGWCWGGGYGASLLGGAAQPETSLVPVRIPGSAQWRSLSTMDTHTCGVKVNGSGWCWGNNDESGGRARGALGNGKTIDSYDPVPVSGPGLWSTISAGYGHTCGIKEDGTAWCWGENAYGQLGADSAAAYLTAPIEVSGSNLWQSIAPGSLSTCAIKSGGTLWCWGFNEDGVLGFESPSGRARAPIQVGDATDWTSVAVGYQQMCATKQDASTWCWKYGDVTSVGTYVSVSRPVGHNCGITTGGALTCWGSNDNGQLGGGAVQHDLVEATMSGTWAHVSTNSQGTCGIRTDGTAWCWGYRGDGRIGNGTAWWLPTPGRVLG